MTFLGQALKQLQKARPIYIVGHERPDGDAMGSQIALTRYLNRLGNQAFLVLTERISEIFKGFLADTPVCNLQEESPQEESYWMAVDCGKPSRVAEKVSHYPYTLVIDHHPEEAEPWGLFSRIQPEATSTCEILIDLLSQHGYKFNDSVINDALYLGLLTDSGNFSHNNVTQHTFECAEHLVRAGVKPYKIIQALFNNKTKEQLKLQSLFLDRVSLYAQGAIAISTLNETDYQTTQTCRNDTEGFVNQLLTLKNAKVAVFIEYNSSFIKGSLRSASPQIPVNMVAKRWDGGGHPCAAGFKCAPEAFSMEELIRDLVSLL